MPKIYFLVSSLGTGRNVTVSLIELYKSNNKKCIEERLGGAPGIVQYGQRTSQHVLSGISEYIGLVDADAIIFNGFRIAEHIEAIYNQYKSTATFIFTRERYEGAVSNEIRNFHKYTTDEIVEQVVQDQKSKIAKVVADNNLVLTYRPVNWNSSFFEGAVLNSEEGLTEIAILGNLI